MAESTGQSDNRLLQGKATKQHILAAAGRLFARKGYDATSIRNLAEEIGIRPSGILYHFQSKQKLFLATIEHFTVELAELNQHFAPLFDVDPHDRQRVADTLYQSIYSLLCACHGPGSVDNLLGLYMRVLVEGNDEALQMLFRCFADVQAALPVFFRRIKPDLNDTQVAFMQQLLWSLLQYPIVSKRLILYDMKLPDDYTPEYLAAAAWHMAYYCCLPLDLPAPSCQDPPTER